MKLHVLTLAFNGMPFLPRIYESLKGYIGSWDWSVVEGPSTNGGSTKWCQPQQPGASTDGTLAFLKSIEDDPRVHVMSADLWPSKDDMANAGLSVFEEPGILWQADSDELFSPAQLHDLVLIFQINRKAMRAEFRCHYFVGPSIRVVPATDHSIWVRAWRFQPGMKFDSHEPPILAGNNGAAISAAVTARLGLTFEHFSWCTEDAVARKCAFYGMGYERGLEGWKRLQQHTKFPVSAKTFFPWMSSSVMLEKVRATSSETRP